MHRAGFCSWRPGRCPGGPAQPQVAQLSEEGVPQPLRCFMLLSPDSSDETVRQTQETKPQAPSQQYLFRSGNIPETRAHSRQGQGDSARQFYPPLSNAKTEVTPQVQDVGKAGVEVSTSLWSSLVWHTQIILHINCLIFKIKKCVLFLSLCHLYVNYGGPDNPGSRSHPATWAGAGAGQQRPP